MFFFFPTCLLLTPAAFRRTINMADALLNSHHFQVVCCSVSWHVSLLQCPLICFYHTESQLRSFFSCCYFLPFLFQPPTLLPFLSSLLIKCEKSVGEVLLLYLIIRKAKIKTSGCLSWYSGLASLFVLFEEVWVFFLLLREHFQHVNFNIQPLLSCSLLLLSIIISLPPHLPKASFSQSFSVFLFSPPIVRF